MRVFVFTSDKYLPVLRPFAWLFQKYWSPDQPVVIAGFTPPAFSLPPNFSFHSIGRFLDYPFHKWSDGVIDFINSQPDQAFICMLDDYWITRPVDAEIVKIAYDYTMQFGYVARVDLTGDRANSGSARFYGKAGRANLIISDPDSPYHMSLMTAVWRREHLLRVLVRGETPWEVEIDGTPRLRAFKDRVIVLGTKEWPIRHTLAFRGGDTGKLLLDDVDAADVDEMRRLGLLEGLE